MQTLIGNNSSSKCVLLDAGRRTRVADGVTYNDWDTVKVSEEDFNYLVSRFGTQRFQSPLSRLEIQQMKDALEHRR